jgi:hypothetical protein
MYNFSYEALLTAALLQSVQQYMLSSYACSAANSDKQSARYTMHSMLTHTHSMIVCALLITALVTLFTLLTVSAGARSQGRRA